ncbi:16336_t:CDS:2, partial [Funneliformis caledonium]
SNTGRIRVSSRISAIKQPPVLVKIFQQFNYHNHPFLNKNASNLLLQQTVSHKNSFDSSLQPSVSHKNSSDSSLQLPVSYKILQQLYHCSYQQLKICLRTDSLRNYEKRNMEIISYSNLNVYQYEQNCDYNINIEDNNDKYSLNLYVQLQSRNENNDFDSSKNKIEYNKQQYILQDHLVSNTKTLRKCN